jgi:hypothetical protein
VSKLQALALVEVNVSSGNSEEGSSPSRWWTRSQRIRTLTEVLVNLVMSEATERPLHQCISAEVRRLRVLGLSLSRIAASLGVSDKTAARALAWAERQRDITPTRTSP